jgi:hypothetical protein
VSLISKAKSRVSEDKRFLYHITTERWGKRRRLIPLPDDHPKIHGRGPGEPEIARICVSLSPADCLSAIYWYIDRWEPLQIYRTARRVKYVSPWSVSDSNVTNEKWLITPTVFVREGSLPIEVFDLVEKRMRNFRFGMPRDLALQRRVRNAFRSVIKEEYGF